MGNAQRSNQVYYDSSSGQYYTQPNSFAVNGMPKKNFLTGLLQFGTKNQKSPINDLLAQSLAAKANPVSMAQLFPSMSNPSISNPMTNYSGLLSNPMVNQMQGQYGAGRFLGGNAMTNYGSTSNAMNTM